MSRPPAGPQREEPSTLYSGRGRVFIDRRLEKGVKYRYTVSAYDEAGNAAVKALAAQLSSSITKPAVTKPVPTRPAVTKPSLTRPAAGARFATPPLLAWTAVPKATYYNVQLYRGGRKILTVWPTSLSFPVERS